MSDQRDQGLPKYPEVPKTTAPLTDVEKGRDTEKQQQQGGGFYGATGYAQPPPGYPQPGGMGTQYPPYTPPGAGQPQYDAQHVPPQGPDQQQYGPSGAGQATTVMGVPLPAGLAGIFSNASGRLGGLFGGRPHQAGPPYGDQSPPGYGPATGPGYPVYGTQEYYQVDSPRGAVFCAWLMFVLGFFFPILWVVVALLPCCIPGRQIRWASIAAGIAALVMLLLSIIILPSALVPRYGRDDRGYDNRGNGH